jgi:hypothetical protein
VVGKFPTDYIFRASGEVVDLVEAFEEPTTGYRASREQRVRLRRWFGYENAVLPKTGEVRGKGRVLACE